MKTSGLHKTEYTGLDHTVTYDCLTRCPNLVACSLKHGFCGSQIQEQFGRVDFYEVAVKMLARAVSSEFLAESQAPVPIMSHCTWWAHCALVLPPWASLLGCWPVLMAGQLVSFKRRNPNESMAEAAPSFVA